jgi:hypothetical protein
MSAAAFSVNASLTVRRRSRAVVENDDYAAFARRVIRAHGRRVAAGDPDALASLVALAREVDAATGDAVTGLRVAGYSWGDIATRLGVSRQAVQQRWGGEGR